MLSETETVAEVPKIRIDKHFPTGVLEFKKAADFKFFLDKLAANPSYVEDILPSFKSFRRTLNDFRNEQLAHNSNSKNENISTLGLQVAGADVATQQEFLIDLNQAALPDPVFESVVNPELDVVIGGQTYQFTRVGTFVVNESSLNQFDDFIAQNTSQINFDPSFNSIPNETPLGNNQFQVSDGIVRETGWIGDLFRPVDYIDDGGGYNVGNGTAVVTPNYFVNATVGSDFSREVAIVFNDWAKRRLVFKTQNISIDLFGWGFHKIDIKAKVQREKRFLWITYWSESFADELIVGCDNMNLETDYVFPHPQYFSTLTKPSFEGLADFEVGNWVVKTAGLKVNLSALNFTLLDNSEISSMVNSQFNSLVGNTYNNIFSTVETKLLNSIDPSYSSRYANYTKRVNSLDNQYKLKWVIGKTEKPQGYSHENTWRFDWNIGGTVVSENGGAGGYPLKYSYKYDMKGGSFFGRARVGNVWHGIRIVRI
jgi:uncharacterized protein (UPF0297 family)